MTSIPPLLSALCSFGAVLCSTICVSSLVQLLAQPFELLRLPLLLGLLSLSVIPMLLLPTFWVRRVTQREFILRPRSSVIDVRLRRPRACLVGVVLSSFHRFSGEIGKIVVEDPYGVRTRPLHWDESSRGILRIWVPLCSEFS